MKNNVFQAAKLKLTAIKIPKLQLPDTSLPIFKNGSLGNDGTLTLSPFKAMVKKEVTDHIRNWRFIILFALITLACLGTLFSTLNDGMKALVTDSSNNNFFFLNLFTKSDGTLPPYFVFVGFLGPLFGISLGFDAISSEQNRGTLSRILAQPVPRDSILNAKFLAGIIVISVMLFSLSFLVLGAGLVAIGIPPTAEEFMRIMVYTVLSIVYVSFWLNLSILFSVRFRQPATSALLGIAVWLFFTLFYPMIANLIIKGYEPSKFASPRAIYFYEKLKFYLLQIMPNELFDEITSAILVPSVRSLGPLTMEQLHGAIPSSLPLGQSVLLVWPQFTGLLALTLLCFLLSYILFMKREIRSRG
ncbi:ABC transporter permease [Zobellia galactanivorans]|uniref:ABC-2 type exporter, permease component n=1 Tax=Zobellia galactanivorans (strain DSM 12802 / CCUG 47099 / CIP 106680 / NCIMB 13871 / Dsij) TaxID=63186 RepID=G0L908_ZOBGA|nr:ABC transporter permease subunit [Zobellia galactanivorans]CAZ94296.1 ABC-2 type exporter, permease component [Zobellia galactanivorans]